MIKPPNRDSARNVAIRKRLEAERKRNKTKTKGKDDPRLLNLKRGGSAKKFPDMSGDGKVTKKDILIAKGVIKKPTGPLINKSPIKKREPARPKGMKKGGSAGKDTHVTKDGRTVKKGLYYYMNRAKKKGTSRKGKGTVTDKALKRSAKTAKK